nr:immunoglobulin light chain junction region [Macaca mulatta]
DFYCAIYHNSAYIF